MDDPRETVPDRPGSLPRMEPARLGRYKIERTIGEGGMGVVYAALDPDLERRVALKVLHTGSGSPEARARLLREARAMARLQHPNVVMVHEVGTAGDTDFVAMELVEGETLAEWLRTPRRESDIVETFLAAGRGLAAAHAAGIVHRDFKPYNVLMGKGGRVQVTDFGLARGVDAPRADPMAQTLPPNQRPPIDDATTTPSSLSGLTTTGLVLGTPAYMAPEQWVGGAVGPATDQFSYCVALWEALAGKRPFGGTTEEELRDEVLRGPLPLDASKLPRRLRPVLLRGLEPKQAKRWPDMDALLHELRRAQRRPYTIIAAIAVVAAATAAGAWLMFADHTHGPGCRVAAHDPAAVWPAGAGVALGDLGAAIDRDVASWTSAREHACAAGVESEAQLACLDAVLARIDAVKQAARAEPSEALATQLVDPALCTRVNPPHLVLAANADVIAALGIEAGIHDATDAKRDQLAARAAALVDRAGVDACARPLALLAVADHTRDVADHRAVDVEAAGAADRCADDHVRAIVAIVIARFELDHQAIEANAELARRAANNAIERVPQSDLVAIRDMLEAAANPDLDQAIALATKAVDGLAKRGSRSVQLDAALVRTNARRHRGSPADLEAIRTETPRWRALAHSPKTLDRLDEADAIAKLALGDVAGAHVALERIRAHTTFPPEQHPVHMEGIVVDREGHAVEGATVATASQLLADPLGVVAMGPAIDLVTTTTDAAGRFVLDAPPLGGVMAIRGEQRSPPTIAATRLRLVLGPTRTLSGRVVLGTTPPTKVFAAVMPKDSTIRYHLMAPLASDGSFTIVGAPVEAVQITTLIGLGFEAQLIATSRPYPAGTQPGTGIVLDIAASTRHVTVIARSTLSTPLEQAMAVIVAGRARVTHLSEALGKESTQQLDRHFAHGVVDIPPALARTLKPGDLIAEFDHIPPGESSACVLGLSRDLMANGPGKMFQHAAELEIRCVPLPPDASFVVVMAPPPPRFD